MAPLGIRVALALLGAILVHSAAFLAGVGEPAAVVVGLVAGPLISWAILAWAPIGAEPPVPTDAGPVPPPSGTGAPVPAAAPSSGGAIVAATEAAPVAGDLRP